MIKIIIGCSLSFCDCEDYAINVFLGGDDISTLNAFYLDDGGKKMWFQNYSKLPYFMRS